MHIRNLNSVKPPAHYLFHNIPQKANFHLFVFFFSFFFYLQVWIFGDLWCRVWLAVDVWMCTASILNLCAISLDRYVAVTRPVTYPSIMSTKRAKSLIAGLWVLSFVICFPPLVSWKDDDDEVRENENFSIISALNYSNEKKKKAKQPTKINDKCNELWFTIRKNVIIWEINLLCVFVCAYFMFDIF